MIKKLFIISLILLIPAFTYADDSIGGGNIHGENAPLAFQDATGDIVRPRTVITTYTDNGDGTITLAAGGGSGTPGGSDGDVQYNDGGSFGGFGDFNDGTNALTIPGSLTSGNIAATVANTINAIALDITQNDTTNNNKAALITNTGTGNALKIDQNGNTSVSTSVGGALLLDNTDNTGAGMIIYSDQGSGASGRLLNIRADNAAFDEAALHVDYDGVANAVEIVHNSSTEDSVALTVQKIMPMVQQWG